MDALELRPILCIDSLAGLSRWLDYLAGWTIYRTPRAGLIDEMRPYAQFSHPLSNASVQTTDRLGWLRPYAQFSHPLSNASVQTTDRLGW
ncbi:hypothetical protein D9611_007986 [Ephemerocybe angulata]|uniref:Uncharacterized protein n=1 Tax=Ephemerocybe angulata TaxID=980116 RepID=A0A8H5BZ84_9AGAR|nr:hypothetical protein D9611_007986 [Tulosesus angulatus]